jgi:hypothetical protein
MEPKMIDRPIREKQLQNMIRTSEGRAEIYRLARVIQGVKPHASMSGMFIGQMIADILLMEYPDLKITTLRSQEIESEVRGIPHHPGVSVTEKSSEICDHAFQQILPQPGNSTST